MVVAIFVMMRKNCGDWCVVRNCVDVCRKFKCHERRSEGGFHDAASVSASHFAPEREGAKRELFRFARRSYSSSQKISGPGPDARDDADGPRLRRDGRLASVS